MNQFFIVIRFNLNFKIDLNLLTSDNFTITTEIHARSLAKFYGQYADRHMNLKFVRRVSEKSGEFDNLLS